jgi:hypothetical protein
VDPANGDEAIPLQTPEQDRTIVAKGSFSCPVLIPQGLKETIALLHTAVEQGAPCI